MFSILKIYKIILKGSIVVGDLMSTRIKYSLISKLILFLCIFCFSALNAFAANSLSGVDVKQTGSDSYKIILKTDNSVKLNKISEGKDNLVLVLNSTIPADSVEIVYDNASDLKNVMIQKKNSDNTMILLQGKNIENAEIYTKEITTGLLKQINTPENSLENYLYISNAKHLKYILFAIIGLFFLMLCFRPKSKKYISANQHNNKKQITVNSIKNKISTDKRYIPSINYRINNVQSNMSVPKEFVISNINKYEEKIRKAG